MTTPLRSVSGRGMLVCALLGLALADATPAHAQGRGRRSGLAGTSLPAAAFVPGVGTGYITTPPTLWRNPLNENPVNPLPRSASDRIQDEIFYEDLYRRTGAYRVVGGLYQPGYGVPVKPEKVAGGYYTPGFGVLNGGLYGAPGSGPPAANVAGGMLVPGFGVVNPGRREASVAGGWGQGATSFAGPALGTVSGPLPMGGFGSPGLAISGPAAIGSFGAPSQGFSGPTNLGGFGTPTGLAGGPAAIGGFGSPPAGAFAGPAAIGGYGQPAGVSGFGAPVGGGVMQGTLVPGQGVSSLVPRR